MLCELGTKHLMHVSRTKIVEIGFNKYIHSIKFDKLLKLFTNFIKNSLHLFLDYVQQYLIILCTSQEGYYRTS